MQRVDVEQYFTANVNVLNELIPPSKMELYKFGLNYNKVCMRLLSRGNVRIITNVERISFDFSRDRVRAKLTNGLMVNLYGVDEDNIEDVLAFPVELMIIRHGKELNASLIRIYGSLRDVENIVEEYDGALFELLIEGLGYKLEPPIVRVLLPRIFALFRVNDVPIYLLQVTRPNSGKTYFGTLMRSVLNWAYTTECPSYAYLLYDARTKTLGQVVLRNGIIFDGVDKWGSKLWNMSTDYEILLTGMENGIWTRAVSGAPEVRKYVNMIFFGNREYSEFTRFSSDKEAIEAIISNVFSNIEPLLERFTVVHYEHNKIEVHDYISKRRLKLSYLRGLIQYIQKLINERPTDNYTSNLRGRYGEHSRRLKVVMDVLGIPEYKYADDIVMYGWSSFYDNLLMRVIEDGA